MTGVELAAGGPAPRRVLVVTVNYCAADLAINCVRSVAAQRHAGLDLRMALVDNASPDDSLDKLNSALESDIGAGWLSITPLACNGGFGWGNNQAILMSCTPDWQPEFIWLLNPDSVAQSGALDALIEAFDQNPVAGAAGSLLIDEAGEPGISAFRFLQIRSEFLSQAGLERLNSLVGGKAGYILPGDTAVPDWVTGASVMLRTAALDHSGLFDDGFFLYFEEIELMHRLRQQGWRSIHVPQSRVMHIGGATTGLNDAALIAARPRPAYWFASRRRYFARTRGAGVAALASIAWQCSSWIAPWLLRLRGRRPPPSAGLEDRTTMRRVGLLPGKQDRQPAFARLGDKAGQAPRWQEWSA
jgi:N-acetylglucosaminyl-diphospho-decaprenol L-rhamnosyltransferase